MHYSQLLKYKWEFRLWATKFKDFFLAQNSQAISELFWSQKKCPAYCLLTYFTIFWS